MAIQTLNTIKNWFKTGLKPTQTQFWDTWDSFRHKYEKVPLTDIQGINEVLQTKTENEVFENHLNDPNAHAGLIKEKLDKGDYNGTAKDLNDRIDAIGSPDTLLQSVKPTRVEAVITFPAMKYVARINQKLVINTLEYSNTINVATANYHRIDLIELRADGTFNKIMGDESLTAAIKPNHSSNAVEVSTINVFGNTISNPTDPFDPTDFLPKGGYSGTGQDLANAIPDLNAPNLKLGGYPNTRNDGQLPTNKVLGTDENGNLKLYTMAISPAPYLEELIPDSYLPNTTGNFVLKGSFFTPKMTVSIQDQTVNYITFLSDNEVHVNVTTGDVEGSFSVTLNNGLSATFPNALLIVLGDIYKPIKSDWEIINGALDLTEEGSVKVKIKDVAGTAKIITPNFNIPNGLDFELRFSIIKSPLENNPYTTYTGGIGFQLISETDSNIFGYEVHNTFYNFSEAHMIVRENNSIVNSFGSPIKDAVFSIKRLSGIVSYYINGNLMYTSLTHYTSNLKIKALCMEIDFYNIKFIHLAT